MLELEPKKSLLYVYVGAGAKEKSIVRLGWSWSKRKVYCTFRLRAGAKKSIVLFRLELEQVF